MEIIRESFDTPVVEECDVLVAGGGIAGIAAALAVSVDCYISAYR